MKKKTFFVLDLENFRKCPEIHISFNISATNAYIVLKLKTVLNHRKANLYTNLHNSDFILAIYFPILDLENVQKFILP